MGAFTTTTLSDAHVNCCTPEPDVLDPSLRNNQTNQQTARESIRREVRDGNQALKEEAPIRERGEKVETATRPDLQHQQTNSASRSSLLDAAVSHFGNGRRVAEVHAERHRLETIKSEYCIVHMLSTSDVAIHCLGVDPRGGDESSRYLATVSVVQQLTRAVVAQEAVGSLLLQAHAGSEPDCEGRPLADRARADKPGSDWPRESSGRRRNRPPRHGRPTKRQTRTWPR
jgi:hypothetical protein